MQVQGLHPGLPKSQLHQIGEQVNLCFDVLLSCGGRRAHQQEVLCVVYPWTSLCFLIGIPEGSAFEKGQESRVALCQGPRWL